MHRALGNITYKFCHLYRPNPEEEKKKKKKKKKRN